MAAWQATFDAHEIAPEEYEDIPELTEDDFARAVPCIGDRQVTWAEWEAFRARELVRPQPGHRKVHVNVLLDHDVLERFRSTGPGWQSLINEALGAVHISATKPKAAKKKAVNWLTRQRRGKMKKGPHPLVNKRA